jgi:hypothetical protein
MKTMDKLRTIIIVVTFTFMALGFVKAHAGNTHTLLSADNIANLLKTDRLRSLRPRYSLKVINETAFIQAHIKYKELQIELLDLQYIKRTTPRKGGEVALQIALKKEQLELKALEIKNAIRYIEHD